MDVQLPENLAGLAEASQQLDAMIAADAAGADGGATPTHADPSANLEAAERAAATGTENVPEKKVNDESTDGTAAAAAEAKAVSQKQTTETSETKAGDKPAEKSRYEKAQERQKKSWEEVNAQKDALKAEREAFAREREAFQREREEYQSQRAKAENEFTPDQYQAAARKFEAEGKFDLADLAKRKAEELRRNPPAKAADKAEAARKEWALKAGVDFPELAKANSPTQVRVAQLLQEEPEFKAHPKGIYLAARLASLESDLHKARSEAAALPAKDAELTKLKARVQELEALTAPGGQGGAQHLPGTKRFEDMSDSEQFALLEQQAREVGVLTR